MSLSHLHHLRPMVSVADSSWNSQDQALRLWAVKQLPAEICSHLPAHLKQVSFPMILEFEGQGNSRDLLVQQLFPRGDFAPRDNISSGNDFYCHTWDGGWHSWHLVAFEIQEGFVPALSLKPTQPSAGAAYTRMAPRSSHLTLATTLFYLMCTKERKLRTQLT